MTPTELVEKLQPIVGHMVEMTTLEGDAGYIAQFVRYLEPDDRDTPDYDVIIERAPVGHNQGTVIPAARVAGVRYERDGVVLTLIDGRERRVFVDGLTVDNAGNVL